MAWQRVSDPGEMDGSRAGAGEMDGSQTLLVVTIAQEPAGGHSSSYTCANGDRALQHRPLADYCLVVNRHQHPWSLVSEGNVRLRTRTVEST